MLSLNVRIGHSAQILGFGISCIPTISFPWDLLWEIITIHYQFSSLAQKEKYLLSYNGQYYEASHAFVKLVGGLQQQEKEEAMRK